MLLYPLKPAQTLYITAEKYSPYVTNHPSIEVFTQHNKLPPILVKEVGTVKSEQIS